MISFLSSRTLDFFHTLLRTLASHDIPTPVLPKDSETNVLVKSGLRLGLHVSPYVIVFSND